MEETLGRVKALCWLLKQKTTISTTRITKSMILSLLVRVVFNWMPYDQSQTTQTIQWTNHNLNQSQLESKKCSLLKAQKLKTWESALWLVLVYFWLNDKVVRPMRIMFDTQVKPLCAKCRVNDPVVIVFLPIVSCERYMLNVNYILPRHAKKRNEKQKFLPSPVDSILEAVLTVSPNKQ